MLYITGDTHGAHDFGKLERFAKSNPQLTKNDYIIIAGDFGAVWNTETLDADLQPYEELPFGVLFIDGNHENFDLLDNYPIELWNGGKVHKIKQNIIHLMRGQIYEFEGAVVFTFGGATSVDKYMRQENISWWRQEMPSFEELDEAISNLKKYKNKVDYIITHSIDEKALYYPPLHRYGTGMRVLRDNQMLSYFEDIVEYRHWYFGHYHIDGNITDKKTALYFEIIPLGSALPPNDI